MGSTHAIVIGGSMAGLCAARVLARFYDKVTVIDRDAYPAGAHERPGVPQSRHVHALLMRGRLELDRLYPGFEKTMLERGALEINFGRDFAALRPDGWAERRPNAITTLFASRVLIEATVRELIRKVPNVELIERAEAVGFETARGDTLRVSGIRVNPRDGGAAFTLGGDLIIDASGRATKVPSWIEAMSLAAPPETVVDSHTGYASRWYKVKPERRPKNWWWKGVWIDPVAEDFSTAGVLFPVEDNRMIVTMAGFGGHYPPSDEDEFTAKLAQLRSPIIAEEVALAEPMSQVYSYRHMANRWRHYEKWSARLDGFIALGDSSCAFNPVYGQGMTTGALSALMLGECLEKNGINDAEVPRKFFAAQARFQAEPWGLATGADFRIPGTEGKRPIVNRMIDPLLGKMFLVANDDPEIGDRIGEVINMMKPPSALFEPSLLRLIVKAWSRRLIRGRRPQREAAAMPPLALGAEG
ncbi:MAG TPA: FAD-dependent monooxygenase [Candidatus Binataceae bacterium]|nr:FAD-dependent monooxygenase [Candidatus Binataceae bacterium]